MFQRTQDRQDEILARDVSERAGAGGIAPYLFGEVRNQSKGSTPDHVCLLMYADGSVKKVTGPSSGRSVPALA